MNDSEVSLKKAVYGDSLTTATPVQAPAAPRPDPTPKLFGMPLKYVSLVTLAIQNAALAIMMHYSRVSTAPSKTYSAGSAVLLNELLKGSISLVIALMRTEPDTPRTRIATASVPTASKGEYTLLAKSKRAVAAASPPTLLRATTRLIGRFRKLGREVFSADCWKLSIPAILYVIQNNLQFVAASNLDVATFQVTYQMKILTTAGFSVLMLRKKLSTVKWLSLLGLAIGVGVVQIQTGAAAHGGGDSIVKHVMNPTKGFLAVSSACLTSGLAGVYFEMVLKGSQSDLWVRNVQLSLFSLLPALVPVFFNGNSTSASSGGWFWNLFENFGGWAWATVLMQVFGGLVTAVVIKYADNIMKGFATSLSIIISFLASVALFDFSITVPFVVGSSIVLGATWFYNQPAPEKPRGTVHEKLGGAVDSSQPILGEINPKKVTPLPTPGSIATAVKGFISRPSSPSSNGPAGNQGGYFPVATGGINGTPLNRTGSQASLHMSKPPSRNQSNIGLGMTGMDGHRSSGSAGSDVYGSSARR
ncbi:hypothetical protein M407DRAFT_82043 [Tulasnella calospora MUT 4182]|uniref:Uncharacterized protein n=1 Tax=Tulasnella calospora MUT 4182 TaxID=1051891 RepID=A0A0C3PXW6_9AGAM|nr:hypothetical protein M407DRAFT_82043 [Tulasnella calospora MUT 4182]